DNQASRALLTKLGFEQEGYLKQRWIVGDEVSDSAIFGLLLPTYIK
ncbi:GNAT family N-acetyltransferase, partial [Proteus mirabilis]